MGVSDLNKYAKMAAGQGSGSAHAPTGSHQSAQVRSGDKFSPLTQGQNSGQNGGTVPKVGSVQSFKEQALHPGNTAAQPPKHNSNGGRAGQKSGQPHIGNKSGNNRLMSGGRAG